MALDSERYVIGDNGLLVEKVDTFAADSVPGDLQAADHHVDAEAEPILREDPI
jgi:hypothetical protein